MAGMRLVTYRDDGGWQPGVEGEGQVVSLASLGEAHASVRALLAAGPEDVNRVLEKAASGSGKRQPLDSVELGPPVPPAEPA